MGKKRKTPSPRSPRRRRRPQSATIAEDLAAVLGTSCLTQQDAILRGWITQWRAGDFDDELSIRARCRGARTWADRKAASRFDTRTFLAWKLGSEDLGSAAFRVLRHVEKNTERLLSQHIWEVPAGHLFSPGRSVKLLSDARLAAALEPEDRSKARRLRRIFARTASGEPFGVLTTADQRAYTSFFWRRLWSHPDLLIRRHSVAMCRMLRRSLLAVATAIIESPPSALRRLIRIGLQIPERAIDLGVPADVAYEAAAPAATIYSHLIESGVVLSSLEPKFSKLKSNLVETVPGAEYWFPLDFLLLAVQFQDSYFVPLLRTKDPATISSRGSSQLMAAIVQKGAELNLQLPIGRPVTGFMLRVHGALHIPSQPGNSSSGNRHAVE